MIIISMTCESVIISTTYEKLFGFTSQDVISNSSIQVRNCSVHENHPNKIEAKTRMFHAYPVYRFSAYKRKQLNQEELKAKGMNTTESSLASQLK